MARGAGEAGIYVYDDANGHWTYVGGITADIEHTERWDGKINGVPLPEERYTICASPAEYDGTGVYYGQMASFEIVGSRQPKAPGALTVEPAASGMVKVSGNAEPNTTVRLDRSRKFPPRRSRMAGSPAIPNRFRSSGLEDGLYGQSRAGRPRRGGRRRAGPGHGRSGAH
ncbi:hypothetical protein [Thermobacillus composti]|uniref:hypothetical protein n=1 Tax=Thermobacillus composti TaxID=377615 RepID=UPI0012FCE8CB|nr:hypothetical protein [Thermobacillus composti]